ncbi:MAG TPA: TetR family transcriptional regulator [Ktedonobacteraceae bacterium]|nr:TetR family transcriptional regulator [Ktedonobacteraceae bacterium]
MAVQHTEKGKRSGRERLLQAAAMLSREHPFDEMTIDDIIKTAELSRPAFYYHFTGGKEELRTELVQRGILCAAPPPNTREAILEAAVNIFARSGVSAATLEDIATEAGVTRGALCWHFHSKDDLLEAIVQRYGPHSLLRPVVEQIEQEVEAGGPIDDEDMLRRLAGAFYDAFTSQRHLTRLTVLLIHTHPDAAHILADMIVKGRLKITEYVRKRQEAGALRKDIDAAFFVQIIAMTFAMRAIGQGLGELLPFSHLSREEIIEQLVSLLMYGIVPRA